jgi:hypothetical protein
MENNAQQPVQQPVGEQAPPVQAAPVMPQQPHKSRFVMLFIILVILGIVFLGGTYAFITMQKNTASTALMNKTVETQSNLHKLDEQLPSVDTKSVDGDFTEVDQELKNL